MTPGEREQLQKHVDAHLRCAERNPGKREQHLKSARYYAELLGIELPRPAFTAESWVSKNPDMFFVSTEMRIRLCSICGKRIAPGEQCFGMYEVNVDRFLRSGDTGDISIRYGRAKRLHRACAEIIR